MSYTDKINPNSGKYFREEPTQISNEISVTSAATVAAVHVPAGAYVSKVAVLATAGVYKGGSAADIDVGDGDTTNLYIDGLSTIATNKIVAAPYPHTFTDNVKIEEASGKYYSSADTIDVVTNTVASGGSIKVMAWYWV